MRRPLAFVLSGGGARGALQVGALRALVEAEIRPDMLVGTSIGAANAAYLAVQGVRLESIEGLVQVWHDAASAELLPSNYVWLTVRTLFNRPGTRTSGRLPGFFVDHGLSPKLRFGDIRGVRLYVVAADLNAGRAVVYGEDPRESVLEAVVASTALPPWVRPLQRDRRLLIDGGFVSNLPIETALEQGAREIVALDLNDPRDLPSEAHGLGPFFNKLTNTIELRQVELETKLAAARGVAVHRLALFGMQPLQVWDFAHSEELIERGYDIARAEIATWAAKRSPWWRKWVPWR